MISPAAFFTAMLDSRRSFMILRRIRWRQCRQQYPVRIIYW